MTSTTPTSLSPEQLAAQILAALEKESGQKSSDLARLIGADRKEVNRCLTHTLAGKVVQDSSYRWSLWNKSVDGTSSTAGSTAPRTELNRLCRYYLESIGQDSDE